MMYRLVMGLGAALILVATARGQEARSLAIVVSRDTQSLAVYDGDQVIATSRVSTGKPGHATPTGIFTIIEKKKYHESNLYSSAPMPFMQRITWSGVALHESNSVPRRPASHGCVRLPHAFAKELFGMTQMGVPVVISDAPLTPSAMIHPFLFRPSNPATNGMLLSEAKLRLDPISDFLKPTEVALNEASIATVTVEPPREDKGLRILITRRGQAELIKDVQALLNGLGYDAGEPDGRLGQKTVAAINAFKLTKDLPTRGNLIDDTIVEAMFKAANKQLPPQGQVYVRQDFKPLFDGSFTLTEPEAALGTHFLQLRAMDPQLGMADWYGFTVPDGMSRATAKRLGITREASLISEVMDRIVLPPELRQKIEASLTPGSVITITDGGIGKETTPEGTDFITLTHPTASGG